jgi:hypothetical protein
MVAVTDRGSRLELYHSRIYGPAIDFSMYALQMEAEQGQVIRLYDASPVCNCHGWVFASGQFGLRDVDVPTILAEHNYVEVRNAEAGDLAVYFDAGRVTHTGLVRMVDVSGLILIESKWGPFGVYLHPPDRQPFDGICRYFRTSRADHRLTIQTVPSAAEDLDDLLARRSCGAERSVAP